MHNELRIVGRAILGDSKSSSAIRFTVRDEGWSEPSMSLEEACGDWLRCLDEGVLHIPSVHEPLQLSTAALPFGIIFFEAAFEQAFNAGFRT